MCESLSDKINEVGDLEAKRVEYRALKDECRELATDTRLTVYINSHHPALPLGLPLAHYLPHDHIHNAGETLRRTLMV